MGIKMIDLLVFIFVLNFGFIQWQLIRSKVIIDKKDKTEN